jgi:hypothetical protein
MTAILVLLVSLAGLSLGLRTTSVLMYPGAHPLDRMALSIMAGALWTAVVFEVSDNYRIFDFGLGLMLSLSPVGLFDLTKWWFRSRGRRGQWLNGASGVRVALRWLFLAALIAAIAGGVVRNLPG